MSTTAAVNVPPRRAAARSLAFVEVTRASNPAAVHASRTYAATAARRGLESSGTLRISSRYGVEAPGAIQLPPDLRVQPASFSAFVAALASYGTAPAAAASNAHEAGGTNPSALV